MGPAFSLCPSKTRLTLLEEAMEATGLGGSSRGGSLGGSRGANCGSGNSKCVHEYQKLRVLGRGRSAKVRLCERVDGELFAMKIFQKSLLRRQRQWDEDSGEYRNALEAVAREIAILKKLRHPHVVRLHEVIDDPVKDKLYLILDYVPGGPLMSGARRQRAFDEPRACGLFRDVVCGLEYLHFQGVVHQDLKPENILLSREGRALIADFGVARVILQTSPPAGARHEVSVVAQSHEHCGGAAAPPPPPPPSMDTGNLEPGGVAAGTALAARVLPPAAAPPPPPPPLPPLPVAGAAHEMWLRDATGLPHMQSKRLLESSDGTLAFRAPETFRVGVHDGRAADTWSLGVTLYLMLFGHLPFLPPELASQNEGSTEGSSHAGSAYGSSCVSACGSTCGSPCGGACGGGGSRGGSARGSGCGSGCGSWCSGSYPGGCSRAGSSCGNGNDRKSRGTRGTAVSSLSGA